MMTAAEAILQRRPFARFDPDRGVPDRVLVPLLSLASHAPSPYHLQPWRFLVVREAAPRDRLRRAAYNHPRLAEAPVAVVVLGYLAPHRTHWDAIRDRMASQARLTPEDVGRMNSEVRRDLTPDLGPDLDAWACRHAQAAATTLLIAAHGLGLAAVPIDRFEPESIRDAFGIPRDHSPCTLVALGYPLGDSPPLDCLPLSELCFQEHFGQPWTLGDAPPDP